MTTPDFASIITRVIEYGDPFDDVQKQSSHDAASVLAAKVPDLCPESGSHDDLGPIPSLGCDLCPTIGQMLREWQALTALAEYAQHDGMCGTSQAYGPITCDCGLDAARAALEETRNQK